MVLVGEKKNGECAPVTFHFHFSPADEILWVATHYPKLC